MKWTETITPKQAVEELGVPYHVGRRVRQVRWQRGHSVGGQDADQKRIVRRKARRHRGIPVAGQAGGCRRYLSPVGV